MWKWSETEVPAHVQSKPHHGQEAKGLTKLKALKIQSVAHTHTVCSEATENTVLWAPCVHAVGQYKGEPFHFEACHAYKLYFLMKLQAFKSHMTIAHFPLLCD